MKEMGMYDWLINTISELYNYFRKGYASQVSSGVEEETIISLLNLQKIMQKFR